MALIWTAFIGGLVRSSTIIGTNYTDTEPLIIAFLTFAFFCNGGASIQWSLVSATAPERLIGLTSSAFNCVAASCRQSPSVPASGRRLPPAAGLHRGDRNSGN